MERIQTNPVHMSLDSGKEFIADVYNFGFLLSILSTRLTSSLSAVRPDTQ
jgi:hypothetical protein